MRLTRRRAAAGLVLLGLAAGGWAMTRRAGAQVLPSLPPPAHVGGPPPLQLPVILPAPAPTPVAAPAPLARAVRSYTVAQPAGWFVREFAGGERVGVWFGDDRLTAELTAGKDGGAVRLDADYAMNKEGVVFGVVTAAEGTGPAAERLGRWVGMPFAVRVRSDGGSLTVRQVWAEAANWTGAHDLLATITGSFAAAAGDPPPPCKPTKPAFPAPPTPDRPERHPAPVDVPSFLVLPPFPAPVRPG